MLQTKFVQIGLVAFMPEFLKGLEIPTEKAENFLISPLDKR